MAQARAATARSAHLAAMAEASVCLVTQRPLYAVKAITPQWKGQWVPPSQSRWELPRWEGAEGHGPLPTDLQEVSWKVPARGHWVDGPRREFSGTHNPLSGGFQGAHMNEQREHPRANEAPKQTAPWVGEQVFLPAPRLSHPYSKTVTHSHLAAGSKNTP